MVGLGLAGVLIVLSPRLSVDVGGGDARETLGALVVLLGAVFSALAQVFVRKMVATESVSAIAFWFSITATCASFVTLPWGWVVPSAGTTALLVTAGLLGGVGQILLTASYRHADASLIAPFDYASILLALGIGYLVFDEVPTGTMLAGAALVIVAGVAIILRERQLGLERKRQRQASGQGH
jgi:drug/metabolite transporter (DMT)-like permease